jgi:hypothetical protein
LIKSSQIAPVNQAEKIAGKTPADRDRRFDPLQRIDEALVIALFALRGMPSMPAEPLTPNPRWAARRPAAAPPSE